MISTQQLVDLLSRPVSQVTVGRAASMRMRRGDRAPTPKQEALLSDYEAAKPAAKAVYSHPASGALPPRPDGPLLASELAWMDRVAPPGTDPASVSHQDAQALAAISRGVSPVQHPADARLVDAVWGPVKEYHDQREAQTALDNASSADPPIPSSALQAVSDAVASEHPELQPHEALGRASRLIDSAAAARRAARDQAAAAAREVAMGHTARSYGRTALTPDAQPARLR